MEFRILNTDFIDVDVIDVFNSLIWTDRYSDCGDFELVLAPTSKNIEIFKEDYYLWCNESDHTMIIEDIRITSDVEEGSKLIVTGRSLESILERRIIWNKTVLSGDFQTGIKLLLDENVIFPTDESRQIENFTFEFSTDPRITSLKIETQFTGTNLYEAIKDLCDTNKLGFRLVLTIDNEFIFSLYAGVDRSFKQLMIPYVIFSPEFENLINSNFFASKRDLRTVTLVAGEGEAEDRVRIEAAIESGAGSGLDRREMYTDARDIQSGDGEIPHDIYLEHLIQRGRDKLSENIIVKSFEGSVDTTHMYIYGKDYFMGDIVQITNEFGIQSTSRVTELVRSLDQNGFEVFPTFTTIVSPPRVGMWYVENETLSNTDRFGIQHENADGTWTIEFDDTMSFTSGNILVLI